MATSNESKFLLQNRNEDSFLGDLHIDFASSISKLRAKKKEKLSSLSNI